MFSEEFDKLSAELEQLNMELLKTNEDLLMKFEQTLNDEDQSLILQALFLFRNNFFSYYAKEETVMLLVQFLLTLGVGCLVHKALVWINEEHELIVNERSEISE